MNIFALSGILAGVCSAAMALLMFWRGRHFIHYIWGIFCLSVMMWGFGGYKVATISDMSEAILWWKISYIGVIFIPVLFTHFVYKFLNISTSRLVRVVYIFGFIFLAADLLSNSFIREVKWLFGQFYYISNPTSLYTLFFIFFISLIVHDHIKLLSAFKKSFGLQKTQIKYFFVATAIGFGGGFFSFLPVYGIDLYPYLNLTVFMFAPIVAYAIFKYRMMDLRVVVRRVLIIIFLSGVTYGAFYLMAWLYINFLGGLLNTSSYMAGLLVAPFFVTVFLWFYDKAQKVANKYFFFTLYNYQKTLNDLGKALNRLNDLNEIVELIVNTVKKSLQLEKAGVLLIDEGGKTTSYKIVKVSGFKEYAKTSLLQDNFLIKYLQEKQKLLVREELPLLAKDSKKEKAGLLELETTMKSIEVSVCLPLISNKKLIGVIILGSKISGDAFTKEDIELLSSLAYQAGTAIDSARLYREVQDFNINLQKKVDEQTEQLRRAYEVEKKANQELEALDKVKNQFLMTVQHHLRTPLTSMRGYADLLLAGTFGKVPKKIEEVVRKFEGSTVSLIKMVNDFLDITQFQLGKDVVSLKEEINPSTVIEEIIKDIELEAKNKNLYLKFEKINSDCIIKADSQKLKAALVNILDNAVKYTNEGGITIKLKAEGQKAKIEITDTGMGIEKERLPELFDSTFRRTEEAKKNFVSGRGIGLYLSGQIVKAHNGKIWAESDGEDKGSTFYIELPVK